MMAYEGRPAWNELTRRNTLGLLVGAGAAWALGCDGTSLVSGTDGAAGTGATDGGTCAVTPEGEIGPYFVDDSDARFNRSNLLSNIDGTSAQTGIALTLTLTVLDSEQSCAPYANAQVDIWHCNSSGIYSDEASESSSTQSWLRG
jgi:protocatechuate 3,4-dioxygenase beta subunit